MGILDGKVALITGAAMGMGAAEAALFAKEGARVVIADVQDGAGQKLAASLANTAFVHLDVSSESEWAAAVKFAVERFGRLNVLVNNAGILDSAPLEDTTTAMFERIFRINQLGPFLGMRTAIPALKAAGGGAIVNISSTAGLLGYPNLTAYSASKFAVRGMTKVAAIELARSNIRVNSVHPGMVDTPMTQVAGADALLDRAKGTTLGRAGKPEEIAALVAFLASDGASYISGGEFAIDGASTAGPANYQSIALAAKG